MTQPPPTSSSNDVSDNTIRVMLVDDSAVVRGSITKILKQDPHITIVSSVANGELALNSMRYHKPDVIILDIEMPVMDGMTALPKMLDIDPDVKIIICSTLSLKNADISLEALSKGATECIAKPSNSQDLRTLDAFKNDILRIVRTIGGKTRAGSTSPIGSEALDLQPATYEEDVVIKLKTDNIYMGKPDIIAIGSSTGGPNALFEALKPLNGILSCPVVITQHMPETFTTMLAQHIEKQTGLPCLEAEQDMPVEAGKVYLARGGKHMGFTGTKDALSIELIDTPPENFCKPAVDPMLRSLTSIFDEKILAVILTGMGQDGLAGCTELADKGGRVIAQDRETSVVWGMPGTVAAAGICHEVLPIQDIGPRMKGILEQ